jgi:hypothetical protein
MTYLPLLSDDEMGAAGEAGVGAVATERGNLPLQAIDVDATLTGLAARVALTRSSGTRSTSRSRRPTSFRCPTGPP